MPYWQLFLLCQTCTLPFKLHQPIEAATPPDSFAGPDFKGTCPRCSATHTYRPSAIRVRQVDPPG